MFETALLFASFVMCAACGWYLAAYTVGKQRFGYVERRIWAYGIAGALLIIERSLLQG